MVLAVVSGRTMKHYWELLYTNFFDSIYRFVVLVRFNHKNCVGPLAQSLFQRKVLFAFTNRTQLTSTKNAISFFLYWILFAELTRWCVCINAADGFDLISQNGSHLDIHFFSGYTQHNTELTLFITHYSNNNRRIVHLFIWKRRARGTSFKCTLTNARQNATDLNLFPINIFGRVMSSAAKVRMHFSLHH